MDKMKVENMRYCFLSALMLLAAPAWAEEPDEELPAGMILHADTPLFGDESEDKWPQAFTSDDAKEFGCTSRVAFGDWQIQPSDPDEDSFWYRISNYGVFHCWANVAQAPSREALAHAVVAPSFFIFLGTQGATELWALQKGAVPGSDYLLLARERGDGIIRRFSLLQRDCTGQALRKGRQLDILNTRYCHVASPADLLAIARRMVKRQPLGILALVPDAKDDGEIDSQTP
ncbi:hypothetical protein [Sphingobium yanoikuyae]|uniref:hypothetical protein n=1 Tax=Sphingobium yanoikuyae TaxID=13690 RepID=UPI0028A60F4B|nr:hypothetical protein [Sphingobium yanoikuyae]